MAGGGLSHLMDPLVGGDFLSSIIPLITEFMGQRALRSDPNILALLNNRIGEYNASNAYNPETGQFQAGNPFGDAASGYGGAFGHDANGNPLSPSGAYTQYGLGQVKDSGARLAQGQGNLANLAASAGGHVAAPSGFNLDVPQGLNPGAVQGVDQSVRRPPTPLGPVTAPRGLFGGGNGGGQGGLLGLGLGQGGGAQMLNDFIGSFAVGTTSVPQTGLAQVHQGEMIVPAAQNPLAGGPSRPLAGMASGMPAPQSMPAPPAPPQAGAPSTPVSRPSLPAAPAAPQYGALSPGLSPEVQAQLVNRGTETIDTQAAALRRQMASQGALAGQGGGGELARRMFDAEVARSGQVANYQRDVGLEAANRQFTDQLAANNFDLNRYLGEANVANQQGQLGVAQGQLALQGELGRGQLGQGQQALNLQGEIQRGQLGVAQGQLGNETYLAQLQNAIQRGQLGQGQQALDLQGEIQRGQLGQGQQALNLQNIIQRGQLGQGQQALNLQGEIQRGQLGNDTFLAQLQQEIQRGQLGQGQQALNLQDYIQRGQLGQGQQALNLQGTYQRGQLAQGQQALNLQGEIQRGQLGNETYLARLQDAIQRGQLGQGQQQIDLQRILNQGNLANTSRGLDIQELLGQGGLANDRYGLETNRQLGQGQLNYTNRAFDANYGRDLNNDAFGQYQYEQNRNDTLMQNLWQQQYMGNQQNQFGDLMGLLSQFAGQSAA